MDNDSFFLPSYTGTKEFTQQQVHTAKATGFGAAADDYAERGIDLNEQLVKNKTATYFLRVNSDAMIGAGIFKGDVVVVDRSLEAKNGKVIIASVGGDLVIRRLEINNNKKRLVPATHRLASIDIDGQLDLWGVVTYVIHSL